MLNWLKTSKLVNKTDYNARIKDIENKIPTVTNLAATAAFSVIENKIPSVSNLIKNRL